MKTTTTTTAASGTNTVPRGIRNNNPVNIISGSNWQGMSQQQNDPRFVQFLAPSWGYRAAMLILCRYHERGWNDLTTIISHWAPPGENLTAAYISYVARFTGLDPHQVLPHPRLDRQLWLNILQAMTVMESGKRYAFDPTITLAMAQGYDMALPPRKA